jgi:hypothetical protein
MPTDDKSKSSGSLQNGKLLLRDFNWVLVLGKSGHSRLGA